MARHKTTGRDFRTPRAQSYSARRINSIEVVQRFLIVCEGKETERNYFEAFRVPRDVRAIAVQGVGRNTLTLVEETKHIKEELEEQNGAPFDQVWCVFDRDSFPAQDFNEAIALAERERFKVAYSNEAFELWYLMHFDYHTAALSRQQYGDMLTQRLERKYRKNDPQIYMDLLRSQEKAIRHARRLLQSYGRCNPERDNPSTTVHLLVEELNRHSSETRNKLQQEIT